MSMILRPLPNARKNDEQQVQAEHTKKEARMELNNSTEKRLHRLTHDGASSHNSNEK